MLVLIGHIDVGVFFLKGAEGKGGCGRRSGAVAVDRSGASIQACPSREGGWGSEGRV